MSVSVLDRERIGAWNEAWALAVVFGAASVPWTYGFVAGLGVPLWPSFVASATGFAAGGGATGFARGLASNLAGIAYGAATLAIAGAVFGGGPIGLSLVVGAFMFLASLHDFVPPLAFTPGGFLGYATLFSVDAAGASIPGLGGVAGATVATVISMAVGAGIGLAADVASERLG